jgi:hypothetical protein
LLKVRRKAPDSPSPAPFARSAGQKNGLLLRKKKVRGEYFLIPF